MTSVVEPRPAGSLAEKFGLRIVPCPHERLEELFRLRAHVWMGEGADPAAFSGGIWRDPRDEARCHWIGLHGDALVAGASFSVSASLAEIHQPETYRLYRIPEEGPIGAPDRLVVHRDWRGRGLVQELLDAQDQAAHDCGAVIALRQASRKLRPLLARRGWRYHGPAIFDARFPHEEFSVMSLDLRAR